MGAQYHGSYEVGNLVTQILNCLGIQGPVTNLSWSEAVLEERRHEFIEEVARVWAVEQAEDLGFYATLGYLAHGNGERRFICTLRLFCQAMDQGIPVRYLPLAALLGHLAWYPPVPFCPGS